MYPYFFSGIRPYFLWLLCFCTWYASGQGRSSEAQAPVSQKYSIGEGLIHPQITRLFRDKENYLWIATKGGVSRFNGESFESYGIRDGLPNLRINGFAQDREGNIWISTRSGLACYNGYEIKAYYFNLGFINSPNLAIDDEQDLWLPREEGLLLFNTSSGYRNAASVFPALSDLTVLDVWPQDAHTLLLLTPEGIYKWEKNSEPPYKIASFSTLASEGNFFAVDSTSLALRYSTKSGAVFHLIQDPVDPLQFHLLQPGYASKNLPRIPLCYQESHHLLCWDYSRENWNIEAENLPHANSIINEPDGSCWIGTEEGLFHFYQKPFVYFPKNDLRTIWSMMEDSLHQIWMASYSERSLYRYDGKSFVKEEVFPSNLFTGGTRNGRGNLLIPSENLIEYNPYLKKKVAELPYKSLFVYYDQIRNLTLLGMEGGLGILDSNNRFSYLGPKDGMHPNYFIICINKDANGRYWMGSFTGLSCYDPATGNIQNYTTENGKLPYVGIASIYRDFYGDLWFASDDGVLRYDPAKDILYPLSEDLMREQVNAISGQDSSQIIIGTQKGIYILDLQKYRAHHSLHLKLYNDHNGYIYRSVDQNGLFTDSQNRIWVSSASVALLDGQKIQESRQILRPEIRKVNNQNLPARFADTLVLPYKTNQVEIFFEGVGSERPIQTEFSYKLIGLQNEWSHWTTNKSISFANLSSGIYEFLVRIKPLNTPKNAEVTDRLFVKVRLPLYQEPYFYKLAFISLAILAALLALAGITWLKSYYKNQQLRLVSSELEARSKYLEVKTLQEQLKPHFVNNILTSIQEKIINRQPEQAQQQLADLAKLMRLYLESSIRSGPDNSKDYRQGHSLRQELELLEKYTGFEKMLAKDNFRIIWEIDPRIDQDNFFVPPMIIQPFVENAIRHGIKHSTAEDKWLRIAMMPVQEGALECIIEDNGPGRQAVKVLQQHSIKAYQSRALELVEKRINNLANLKNPLRITIETTDIIPHGTRIRILFID